jgi:hypothetical protein
MGVIGGGAVLRGDVKGRTTECEDLIDTWDARESRLPGWPSAKVVDEICSQYLR